MTRSAAAPALPLLEVELTPSSIQVSLSAIIVPTDTRDAWVLHSAAFGGWTLRPAANHAGTFVAIRNQTLRPDTAVASVCSDSDAWEVLATAAARPAAAAVHLDQGAGATPPAVSFEVFKAGFFAGATQGAIPFSRRSQENLYHAWMEYQLRAMAETEVAL
jgi:hypothetical protein